MKPVFTRFVGLVRLLGILGLIGSPQLGSAQGTVEVWGSYTDYVPESFQIPTYQAAGLSNIVAVAGGAFHSLALERDGTVYAWGYDYTSELYVAGGGQNQVPAGLTNVIGIAAGTYHNLALKSDGTVVAWGENNQGQTNVPEGLTNIVAVAAGLYHNVALRADGTVVVWKGNTFWNSLTNVPPDLTSVVAITAGEFHSMALKDDGTVVAWGLNAGGALDVPAGLSNVVAIATSRIHNEALRADGTVVSWGLGVGTPAGVSNVVGTAPAQGYSAVLNADGTVRVWNQWGDCWICPPAGLTQVVAIASGTLHTLALIDEGTIVWPSDLPMARLRWLSSGDATWFTQTNVTYDGGDAFQSGAIQPGQVSRLRTTVHGPGRLSFWWKVAGKNKHDFLSFSIDSGEQRRISANADWEQQAIEIPPGIAIVEWVYAKGKSLTRGHDAAWLDRVRFAPRGTLSPSITFPPRIKTSGAEPAPASSQIKGVKPLRS
jgi:Regulator of chromosome condensation (RCC1) repeat